MERLSKLFTKMKAMSASKQVKYTNPNYWIARKALAKWGTYVKNHLIRSQESYLAKLCEYGESALTIYRETSYYYPDILHTQRLWALMPSDIARATYLHYCSDTTVNVKSLAMGVKPWKFRMLKEEGVLFYAKYYDTCFCKFDYQGCNELLDVVVPHGTS